MTLGLVHGSAPDLMVLCHDVSRAVMKGYESEGLPLRSLNECVAIYEHAASWRRPPDHPLARVVAVALNTSTVDRDFALASIRSASRGTGLEAADPIREGGSGGDRLARALMDAKITAAAAKVHHPR